MADRGRRLLTVLLVGLAVCTAPAAAGYPSVDVRANVTFERRGPEFTKVRVIIVRKSRTWRSGPLGQAYFHRPKLHVRDLDADGEVEVWVDTYTGGAHCCDESRFFRWLPARNAYRMTFHSWGNAPYRAKNLDGRARVELLSGDDRFAYVFTSFAGSPFPIRIWQFDSGRLRDVTRLFPGQVELDAKGLWRTYLEHTRNDDVRGVLAAWQADQYLLGREDEGWQELERALKRGDLKGPNGFWPTGRRYLRELRAFLVKMGYA
ncbi:MAG: hypothetical protein ACRDLU_02025 [Gaiellaceae bacterium]